MGVVRFVTKCCESRLLKSSVFVSITNNMNKNTAVSSNLYYII